MITPLSRKKRNTIQPRASPTARLLRATTSYLDIGRGLEYLHIWLRLGVWGHHWRAKTYTPQGDQTDPRSVDYLGARVGSNNTGELSAWLEAALYLLILTSLPQTVTTVTFCYDSKWLVGMLRGEHRPKRHKQVVRKRGISNIADAHHGKLEVG